MNFVALILSIIMVVSHAFCNVAAMPMRSEPSHRAEQVNQVLFGERM